MHTDLRTLKVEDCAAQYGVSAEHFVCAHIGISVHLSLVFTSVLTHGHMLMKTAIVLISQNRQGDTSDKNNRLTIGLL